jgi:HK97 family phage portal protein
VGADLLTRLMGPIAEQARPHPADDFWYSPVGALAAAGIRVTPETAMKVSAFQACIDIRASTVAQTPLIVYRKLSGTDRERAINHPLYDLLHDSPNEWQTAAEFKKVMQVQTDMRGNGFAQIVPGERGFVDQLVPIHPDRIKPLRLPSGVLVYDVKDEQAGTTTRLMADEVFHLRGLSMDGVMGVSNLETGRDSIGLALAAEEYSSRSYSQGVKLAGILSTPGVLDEEKARDLAKRFNEAYGGQSGAFKVAVLEQDLKWQAIAMTNKDAELIASREYQVEDIARRFKMPLVMLQSQQKTTTWGTGVEQIMLGFVTFTMMEIFVNWEQRVKKDLILAPQQFYAEFLVDSLLRADAKTRAEIVAILMGWGVLSLDEARALYNLNALQGGLGEAHLRPTTHAPLGQDSQAAAPSPPTEALVVDPRYRALCTLEARRIVKREQKAIEHAARKYAEDPEGWRTWVGEFYGELAEYMTHVLEVEPSEARRYATCNRDELLFGSARVAEAWEETKVPALRELLMGGA